eukprot:7152701-Pyramimonas_sp.AAC.1
MLPHDVRHRKLTGKALRQGFGCIDFVNWNCTSWVELCACAVYGTEAPPQAPLLTGAEFSQVS